MTGIIPEFETNTSRDTSTHGSLIVRDKSGRPHILRVICPYILKENPIAEDNIVQEEPFFTTADKLVSANYSLPTIATNCSNNINETQIVQEEEKSLGVKSKEIQVNLIDKIDEKLLTELEEKLDKIEIDRNELATNKSLKTLGRIDKRNRYPLPCTLSKKQKEEDKRTSDYFESSIANFLDVPYKPTLSIETVRGINVQMTKALKMLNIKTVDNLLKFIVSIRNSRKYFAHILVNQTDIDRVTLKRLMSVIDNFMVSE